MATTEFSVTIFDENISGALEYTFKANCDPENGISEEEFFTIAKEEVETIRENVGRWHNFGGTGDVLLNSAYTIKIEAIGSEYLDTTIPHD